MKGGKQMSNWDNNNWGLENYDVLNSQESVTVENSNQVEFYNGSDMANGQDVFSYSDPLKYSHQFEFKPLNLNVGSTHLVDPHYVDSYIRQDGTLVEGYYRDGDGDSNVNTSKSNGGGYIRSNPDGNPFNNLK